MHDCETEGHVPMWDQPDVCKQCGVVLCTQCGQPQEEHTNYERRECAGSAQFDFER